MPPKRSDDEADSFDEPDSQDERDSFDSMSDSRSDDMDESEDSSWDSFDDTSPDDDEEPSEKDEEVPKQTASGSTRPWWMLPPEVIEENRRKKEQQANAAQQSATQHATTQDSRRPKAETQKTEKVVAEMEVAKVVELPKVVSDTEIETNMMKILHQRGKTRNEELPTLICQMKDLLAYTRIPNQRLKTMEEKMPQDKVLEIKKPVLRAQILSHAIAWELDYTLEGGIGSLITVDEQSPGNFPTKDPNISVLNESKIIDPQSYRICMNDLKNMLSLFGTSSPYGLLLNDGESLTFAESSQYNSIFTANSADDLIVNAVSLRTDASKQGDSDEKKESKIVSIPLCTILRRVNYALHILLLGTDINSARFPDRLEDIDNLLKTLANCKSLFLEYAQKEKAFNKNTESTVAERVQRGLASCVSLLMLEHLYYRPASTQLGQILPSQTLKEEKHSSLEELVRAYQAEISKYGLTDTHLDAPSANEKTVSEMKSIALLCLNYFLANNNKAEEARTNLLSSQLHTKLTSSQSHNLSTIVAPEEAGRATHTSSLFVPILFNRLVAQFGIHFFKQGQILQAYLSVFNLCLTGRGKELLGETVSNVSGRYIQSIIQHINSQMSGPGSIIYPNIPLLTMGQRRFLIQNGMNKTVLDQLIPVSFSSPQSQSGSEGISVDALRSFVNHLSQLNAAREPTFLEKQRMVPAHTQVGYEQIESIFYFCCVCLEMPVLASQHKSIEDALNDTYHSLSLSTMAGNTYGPNQTINMNSIAIHQLTLQMNQIQQAIQSISLCSPHSQQEHHIRHILSQQQRFYTLTKGYTSLPRSSAYNQSPFSFTSAVHYNLQYLPSTPCETSRDYLFSAGQALFNGDWEEALRAIEKTGGWTTVMGKDTTGELKKTVVRILKEAALKIFVNQASRLYSELAVDFAASVINRSGPPTDDEIEFVRTTVKSMILGKEVNATLDLKEEFISFASEQNQPLSQQLGVLAERLVKEIDGADRLNSYKYNIDGIALAPNVRG
ncbi:hypothetical protein BLNAU_417 [Blattamonas nauphoetae]|uniref:PCI domain-containing protein n=1 Tax=Blattamonas nauphoetae TaxID=2049346 RepID=A0ABQ9YL59_9EUKA|nr:hypothetical protein BLNAU_417 [Blattamonas nauphoetae]